MLQQREPDDYVLATGEATSVRDLVRWAFQEVGSEIEWQGQGVDEKGYDKKTGKCLVEVDPRYYRPTEVDLLIGDSAKARQKLGWIHKTGIRDLLREMVQEDLAAMAQNAVTRDR